MISNADTRMVRLLQLASPTLPVGAYSYSQGLESAVEASVARDVDTAHKMDRRRVGIFSRAHGSAAVIEAH